MTDGMKEGWMDKKEKKYAYFFCFLEICILQWNPLNLITLGQNKLITLTKRLQ
jgi:hypothetical protein